MPTTLTDSSSFDPVTGPIGTDIRNAASVRSALQTLANRTKFLFDRSTPLADIAALKAISSPADGLVRFVTELGFFVFEDTSVLAEVIPFVVEPGAGTGRWLHMLHGVAGVAGGVALLDGSQNLLVQGAGNPTFETPRTRVVHQPPIPFGALRTGWLASDSDTTPGVKGPGTNVSQYFLLTEVHDGATLTQVDALVIIDGGHAALPAAFPYLNTFRVEIDVGGGGVDELASGSGVDFPTPANLAAYEAAGVKAWTQTVDQNNVIDRSQYLYYARVDDEQGANALAGNRFLGFKLTFDVVDMRFA